MVSKTEFRLRIAAAIVFASAFVLVWANIGYGYAFGGLPHYGEISESGYYLGTEDGERVKTTALVYYGGIVLQVTAQIAGLASIPSGLFLFYEFASSRRRHRGSSG